MKVQGQVGRRRDGWKSSGTTGRSPRSVGVAIQLGPALINSGREGSMKGEKRN